MRKRDLLKEMIIGFRCMFGTFGRFFRIYPHYGPLLHLENYSLEEIEESPINLDLSLQKMNDIFKTKSRNQIKKGVSVLLKSQNWRNHLVGCLAIVKMDREDQKEYFSRLWSICLNNESWVYPQILATLSIVDSRFSDIVNQRKVNEACLNNKGLKNEIATLLDPDNKEKYENEDEPNHGLHWKENLEKLISEGKL